MPETAIFNCLVHTVPWSFISQIASRFSRVVPRISFETVVSRKKKLYFLYPSLCNHIYFAIEGSQADIGFRQSMLSATVATTISYYSKALSYMALCYTAFSYTDLADAHFLIGS